MISNAEKHEAAVGMAEMLEAIDDVVKISQVVEALELKDFTSENWEDLQRCQEANRALLETLRQMLIEGSKLFDNDAVLAHIEAVVTAQ